MKNVNEAAAIWYDEGPRAIIRPAPLAEPGPDEVLIEALVSGVSRGTESLVFQGKIPDSEKQRMRAPHQEGAFPYPVKYGYAMVGKVVAGCADLVEKNVFCLHPHQTLFVLNRDKLTEIPVRIPDHRAVLAPNMETALNAIWDAGAGPADRIAVVGAGVVGCLTAYLVARLPGSEVCLIDIDAGRETVAERLGVPFRLAGTDIVGPFDIVFHASASESGLRTALSLAGFESDIVELSWYGADSVSVELGGSFHANRLRLIASQVGSVSARRRSRWDHQRRLSAAMTLLDDDRLDALLDAACPFREAPARLAEWLAPGAGGLCHRITYERSRSDG